MTPPAPELDQLSSEQRRLLLAEMLRKRTSQAKDRVLSLGQERLWLLASLNPDVPLYNVSVAYRIRGPLDVRALERSVRTIEQRHDVLRTTFPVVDGLPVQRIAPAGSTELPWAVVEVEHGTEPAHERQIVQLATDEARQIFDIGRGPLWRTRLLRLAPEEHVLTLTMHHMVTDGWSFSVFCQELGQLYDASSRGLDSHLGVLPTQYADFAMKQRDLLAGPESEEQRTYWKRQLGEAVPSLRLPADHPGAARGNHRGSSSPFQLTKELSLGLTELSQRRNATLFMALLAGFQVLLRRETGQEDLLVCTPVTGRHRSQAKDLIGYFNNILLLRFDLHGDPSFQDLIERTRRVALEAYKNQDMPFQQIADLPALRHVSLSGLLFSLDMEWPPRLALAGLGAERIPLDNGAADFDLSVSVWTTEGQILGNVKYNADVFDESTISRLIHEYQGLLDELVATPERRLSSQPRGAAEHQGSESNDDRGSTPVGIPDPARTALEVRLVREWEDVFGIRPIGVLDDLLELGVSSLAVAQLTDRIQRTFHAKIPVTAIFQARNIVKMAELLHSHDPSLLTSPLAPIRPEGDQPPLFLCEGVGVYYPLVPYLPPDRPVYALITELVGNYPRVEDLAAHYVQEVLALQPEGPYFLGGVSFGGLVAFEMAQQLVSSGREVALLALLDTPGPQAFRPKPPLRRLLGYLRNLRQFGYPYLRSKLNYLQRKLKKQLTPAPLAKPLSSSRLLADHAQVRAFFTAMLAQYSIKPYPGRVTLFKLGHLDGMSDSLFDPALGDVDPMLGWGGVAAGGVEMHDLPGGHMSILREPHVQVMGEILTGCLERAKGRSDPGPAEEFRLDVASPTTS